MPSLWFVVPAHGRAQLARICLKQLRHTCDLLTQHGIEATAVVIASDENLDTAAELGFASFGRVNDPLSRKFNDGIALALDPCLNERPADYVAMCGSDDWVDHRLFLNLPPADTILAFRLAAFVNEDGTEIVSRHIDYDGGVGIRVYPRQLLERLGYRPADETRKRGCDTSILTNVSRARGERPTVIYGDLHPWQIVDWKSPDEQLNQFSDITARFRRGEAAAEPFATLASIYPADLLDEMRAHYERIRSRPAIALEEGGFTQYEVLRSTGYRGFPKGTVFEGLIPGGAEGRAIARGDIRILQRNTVPIQHGSFRLPAGWPSSSNLKEVAST